MAAPARVPLGGETLNRKWWIDVNTGTYAAPTWTPVNGVVDFKPTYEPTTQDDSDFDSAGAKSEVVTAYSWGAELKLARKVTVADATIYDTGQEAIRTVADNLGTANVLDIRFYEVNSGGPKTEAYRGYVVAKWSEDGGTMDALDSVTVSLIGKGARTAITHPDSAASVPIVSSITPAVGAAAGGEPVYIYGQFFTGTTAVKMGAGGTAFTDFNIISDYVIVGTVPAKVAATYIVEVTNATGASTGGPSFVYS